jgi:hypothetical protein
MPLSLLLRRVFMGTAVAVWTGVLMPVPIVAWNGIFRTIAAA